MDIAFNNNFDKSLVSRWCQPHNRKDIIDGQLINTVVFKCVLKGGKVSYSWLYTKASIIHEELRPDANRLPKTVIVSYIKKYNIKLRRVQRKKKSKRLWRLQLKWHCTLREGLIKYGSQSPDFHPKWGRFPPEKHINVDQIPLPFAIDRKTT